MVLRYYGKNVHIWDISNDIGYWGYFGADKIAFYINTKYPSEFETVVGRYSQVTEKTRRDIESNLTQGYPIILDLKVKHIVVLVGFNETGFFVHDPSGALILDLGMPYQRHNIARARSSIETLQ